jgi:predicted nucleic acid-binding protein
MNRFVLDTSVVVSWFFEWRGYTATVLESLTDWKVVVPSLLQLEVANALLVAERRKRCSEAEAVKRTVFNRIVWLNLLLVSGALNVLIIK